MGPEPRFFTTDELVTFCDRWKLPRNDVWLFTEMHSLTKLFTLYDTCREGIPQSQGNTDSEFYTESSEKNDCIDHFVETNHERSSCKASRTMKQLTSICNVYKKGTCDHVIHQGELLEGLVVRLITTADNDTSVTRSILSNQNNCVGDEFCKGKETISAAMISTTTVTVSELRMLVKQHNDTSKGSEKELHFAIQQLLAKEFPPKRQQELCVGNNAGNNTTANLVLILLMNL